jgi:hypothetical protein
MSVATNAVPSLPGVEPLSQGEQLQAAVKTALEQLRGFNLSAHQLSVLIPICQSLHQGVCSSEKRLYVIHGAPGTGKSYMINALVAYCTVYGFQQLITAVTVEAEWPKAEWLELDSLEAMSQHTRLLILDEVNMMSAELNYQLETHCRKLGGDMQRLHLPYGGLAVVLVGDFLQQRCELETPIYDFTISGNRQQRNIDDFRFFELIQQMRVWCNLSDPQVANHIEMIHLWRKGGTDAIRAVEILESNYRTSTLAEFDILKPFTRVTGTSTGLCNNLLWDLHAGPATGRRKWDLTEVYRITSNMRDPAHVTLLVNEENTLDLSYMKTVSFLHRELNLLAFLARNMPNEYPHTAPDVASRSATSQADTAPELQVDPSTQPFYSSCY